MIAKQDIYKSGNLFIEKTGEIADVNGKLLPTEVRINASALRGLVLGCINCGKAMHGAKMDEHPAYKDVYAILPMLKEILSFLNGE